MANSVNLSQLPTINGKIDWRSCDMHPVTFEYKGVRDVLFVKRHLNQDYVEVVYNQQDYMLPKISLTRAALGKLFNAFVKDNYKYSVGDILEDDRGSLKFIEHIRLPMGKVDCKGYRVECLKCGNEFTIKEGNLAKGDRCSACSGHKTVIGINDLWTVRPDIAANLTNPDDGYKYTAHSNKQVDFTCCECGAHIGKKVICDVTRTYITCPICSDHISYPNKFMFSVLSQLNINFRTEVKFDWCVFPSYDGNKNTYGIYDFVLDDLNLIIEMDGGLGHGNNEFKGANKNASAALYCDKQKDILAKSNGYEVIRISCAYYDMKMRADICKEAIINSKFAKLFNISSIDWNMIYQNCSTSVIHSACNMYNDGLTTYDIAIKLKKAQSTVIDYLKTGTEIGLCQFVPYKNTIRRK